MTSLPPPPPRVPNSAFALRYHVDSDLSRTNYPWFLKYKDHYSEDSGVTYSYAMTGDRNEFGRCFTLPLVPPQNTNNNNTNKDDTDSVSPLSSSTLSLLHLFFASDGRPIESTKLFQSTLYTFDYILIDTDLLLQTDIETVNKRLYNVLARKLQKTDKSAPRTTSWSVVDELVWMLCSIGNDRRQRANLDGHATTSDCDPVHLVVLPHAPSTNETPNQIEAAKKLLLVPQILKLFDLFNVRLSEERSFFNSLDEFTNKEWRPSVAKALNLSSSSSSPFVSLNRLNNISPFPSNPNSSATVAILCGKVEHCFDRNQLSVRNSSSTGVFVKILSTSNNNRDVICPNQCIILHSSETGAVKRIRSIRKMTVLDSVKNHKEGRTPTVQYEYDEIPFARFGDIVQFELTAHEEFGHGGLRAQVDLRTAPALGFVGSDDLLVPRSELEFENGGASVSTGIVPQNFSYDCYFRKKSQSIGNHINNSTKKKNNKHGGNNPSFQPSATPFASYPDEIQQQFYNDYDDQTKQNANNSNNNSFTLSSSVPKSFGTSPTLFATLVRLRSICPADVLGHCSVVNALSDAFQFTDDSTFSFIRPRGASGSNADNNDDDAVRRQKRERSAKIASTNAGEFFVMGPWGMSIGYVAVRRTFEGYRGIGVPKEKEYDDLNDPTGKPCVVDCCLRAVSDCRFGPMMFTHQQEEMINQDGKSNFFGTKFRQPGTGEELKKFLSVHPLVLVVRASPFKEEKGLIIEPFVVLRTASSMTMLTSVVRCLENKPMICPEAEKKLQNNNNDNNNAKKSSSACQDCCHSFVETEDLFPEMFQKCFLAGSAGLVGDGSLMPLQFTLTQLLSNDCSTLFQYDRGLRCRIRNLLRQKLVEIDDDTGDAEEKSLLLPKSVACLLSAATDATVTTRNFISFLSCISCQRCRSLWLLGSLVESEKFKLINGIFAPSDRTVHADIYSRLLPVKHRAILFGAGCDFKTYSLDFKKFVDPFEFLLFSSCLNRKAVEALAIPSFRSGTFLRLINDEEKAGTHLTFRDLPALAQSSPSKKIHQSVVPDLLAARSGHPGAVRLLLAIRSEYMKFYGKSQYLDLPTGPRNVVFAIDTVLGKLFSFQGLLPFATIDILHRWNFVHNDDKSKTITDFTKLFVHNLQDCPRAKPFCAVWHDYENTLLDRLSWIGRFAESPLVVNLSNNTLYSNANETFNQILARVRNQNAAQRQQQPALGNYNAIAHAITATRPVVNRTTLKVVDAAARHHVLHWLGARFERRLLENDEEGNNNNNDADILFMILYRIMGMMCPTIIFHPITGRPVYALDPSVLFGI